MIFFLACIYETNQATTCIPPQPVESVAICQQLEVGYRQNAEALNNQIRVRTRCLQVDAKE